jgi:UMF1 family MFS transporter
MVIPIAAIAGNYFWLMVQRKLALSSRQMLLVLCFLFAWIPAFGLLGFWLPFGLKSIPEVYVVCVWQGWLQGALLSTCRVLFSELLPRGHENEFFSLYAITDNGSAWIGPLVVGVIADRTHDLRHGFWFIGVLLLAAILVVWTIDVKKGKEEADNYAQQSQHSQ